MALHDRLKKARKSRKLTQDQLASMSGLTGGYISMLERPLGEPNSVENPGLRGLRDLAEALDVPLLWLLEGEGPEPAWDDPKGEEAAS
jgi:transcriptional regulator with XRE-family HTH domain